MSNSKRNEPGDDALGLNTPIERRDLLNSTLLAAGGLLLNSIAPFQLLAEEDWTGYGGVGDYARSNGNTYEVMTDGHKIRDHVYGRASTDAIDTGEEFDSVIVGGGISGLTAALFFQQEDGANPAGLVLDKHTILGGQAK